MSNEILRTALFIVLAFLNFGTKAQPCDTLNKQFKGAVILRAEKKKDAPGSILRGCIKLMSPQEMFVAPKLVDSSGNSNRFFGRQALAYWYIHNKDTIYYLNSGRNLPQNRWIFLERILNGPMELYFFKIQGYTSWWLPTSEYKYFFLCKDGNWLNKKAIVWNEGGKRKRPQKIFGDCKPALELISTTKNLELDIILPLLVTIYNNTCYFNK